MADLNPDKLRRIMKRLENDGYDMSNAKKLGGGQKGIAYKVGNRVVKITKDRTEANSMAYIKKFPHNNIVRVYRAFMYKSVPGLYVIDQEQLKGMSENQFNRIIDRKITKLRGIEPDKFPWLTRYYRRWGWVEWGDIFVAVSGDSQGKLEMTEAIRLRNRVKSGKDLDGSKLSSSKQKILLDILLAGLHLKKIGVKFEDYHGGNIMKGKNGYKLIDLGLSRAPEGLDDIR